MKSGQIYFWFVFLPLDLTCSTLLLVFKVASLTEQVTKIVTNGMISGVLVQNSLAGYVVAFCYQIFIVIDKICEKSKTFWNFFHLNENTTLAGSKPMTTDLVHHCPTNWAIRAVDFEWTNLSHIHLTNWTTTHKYSCKPI